MQVIPHVTEAIKERIRRAAEQSGADIVISEIGGTIGDIEGLPFIEAARQFKKEMGPGNVLFVHVTLVPYIAAAHEVKTKPTQHSVKELRSLGVQPDFIVCRSDHEITDGVREKIALFCDVDTDDVLACPDAPSIYEVPISLYEQGFDISALAKMGLAPRKIKLAPWRAFLKAKDACAGELDIAVVGKYVSLPDAYLSINEALVAAGIAAGRHVNVHLIDGEELTDKNAEKVLGAMDGILVPGGFGARAFENKIAAAPATPARTTCRFWASAWGFRQPSAPLPATCAAWKAPLPPSSPTRRPRARPSSLTSCPSRRTWKTRAAPCAWAPTPARW